MGGRSVDGGSRVKYVRVWAYAGWDVEGESLIFETVLRTSKGGTRAKYVCTTVTMGAVYEYT